MTTNADRSAEPVVLDARGERCPLPVIRLGRLVRELPAGALIRLLATDPAARSDVPAFCRMRGHDLVEVVDGAPDHPPDHPPDHQHARYTAYLVRVSATAAAAAL
ncbi:MAG: sulfurtransferase TusA family protein [Lapillicoccus sp.]